MRTIASQQPSRSYLLEPATAQQPKHRITSETVAFLIVRLKQVGYVTLGLA